VLVAGLGLLREGKDMGWGRSEILTYGVRMSGLCANEEVGG
jgi:hypothetical protein